MSKRTTATRGVRPPRTNEVTPVKYVTKLDESILTKDFKEDLRQFYKYADEDDRRHCVQLLSSLNCEDLFKEEGAHDNPQSNKRTQQRPKTAMAAFGGHSETRPSRKEVKRTLTTYRRDFPAKEGAAAATLARPSSTEHVYQASHGPKDPVGMPTYRNEYYSKGYCRPELIRSGTSSGQRKNNPHPFQSFIVWKLPKKVPGKQRSYPTILTDQMMEEILRDKSKSTYESDYLGIPKGYQMTSAFEKYPDHKEEVPYSLDSYMRSSYQFPKQQDILRVSTNRYGCNRTKHVPTTGIAPNISPCHMHLRKLTTYDHFFNRQMKPGMRDVRESLKNGKLADYMQSADDKDRDTLMRVIQSLEKANQDRTQSPTSKNNHVKIRPKSAMPTKPTTPPSSKVRQRPKSSIPSGRLMNNPASYISTWIGPT